MSTRRTLAVLIVLQLGLSLCLSCNRDDSASESTAKDTTTAIKPLRERISNLRPLLELPVPTGTPGRGFAISPDGKQLAIGASDGSVMLVPTNGALTEPKILVAHKEMVLETIYTPDGKRMVTGGADNRLCIWDRHSGKLEHRINAHNGDVKALASSSDGTMVASGSVADDVRVWRLSDGKRTQQFEGHSSTIYAVLFSQNGQHVFSGARDSQLRRWSLEKGKGDAAPLSFRNTIVALRWTPDYKHIVVAGLIGELAWVDPTAFKVIHRRRVGRTRIVDMDVTYDGTIAVAEQSGLVSFWSSDPKIKEPLFPPIQAHRSEILQIGFLPRSPILLTLAQDGTLGRWDSGTAKAVEEPRPLPPINGMVRAVAAHPSKSVAAIASRGRLFLLDTRNAPKKAREPQLGPGGLSALRYSPDGRHLLMGRDNGHIVMRTADMESKVVKDVAVHNGSVRHMAFTADGSSLWTAGDDIALYHLDPKTLQPRRVVTEHTSQIVALAVDPMGKRVASSEEDHITFIRYAKTNTLQWTRRGHHISHLAFDPTGEVLAMVENRRLVMLYDVEARRELKKLQGNAARLQDLVFHPNGEVLLTLDAHGNIRVWSVADGANLASADAGRGKPTGLAIGDHGSLIVSGGMDPRGSAKLFELGPYAAHPPRP